MQPFEIPQAIRSIIEPHPSAEVIIRAARLGGTAEVEAIARLWLSEGIPFAFREMPALYEVLRAWLARRLAIHAKELTLIGSARQGSSIAPPKMGKTFNAESDLDWTAISDSLFERCTDEFNSWADDYRAAHVHPRNPTEKGYWDENLSACPRTIERGFIDPHKIPTWDRYPTSQLINQTMWMLKGKCETAVAAPKFKKSTIRIYKDWPAFIRQLSINLKQLALK
jgi:hypothetical protein